MEPFRTREQLATELGLSYSTFRRKMKEKSLEIPKGLLSPDAQTEIKKSFGCMSPPVPTPTYKRGEQK